MSFFRRRSEPDQTEPSTLYPLVRDAIVDIQAYARSHGGEITLLGVSPDGDVNIRLTGACDGCPLSDLTLKHGIEEQLKALVPGVRQVVAVK